MNRKLLFTINRLLLVLAVAAILIGLYHDDGPNSRPDEETGQGLRTPTAIEEMVQNDEWHMVYTNARILCLSCIGIE